MSKNLNAFSMFHNSWICSISFENNVNIRTIFYIFCYVNLSEGRYKSTVVYNRHFRMDLVLVFTKRFTSKKIDTIPKSRERCVTLSVRRSL